MKGFKKFLVYLGIFLAIILAAIVICIAIMYFSPRTSILGYEYVSYTKLTEETLSTASGTYAGLEAIEVKTEDTDIYVYPSVETNKIQIRHNQGLSGFVKSMNANLSLTKSVLTKSFEESLTDLKTLSINLEEPNGWISNNNAFICIYVPTALSIDTYNISSASGNVYYYSDYEYNTDEEFVTNNLYLRSGEYSDIIISNPQSISNYYLTTDKGDIIFKDVTTLSANNLKFTTNAGGFNLVNLGGSATLNLTGTFTVKSFDRKIGPYIRINKLNANMDVEAYNGRYIINTIGEPDSHKLVTMTTNKSNVDFGTVYAYVSILSDGGGVSNNVKIDKLYHTADTNIIESGAGNITINNLSGNVSLDSTKGSVNVKNATVASSIYAYSSSGSVNVKYAYSKTNNSTTKLTVLTHTGNINLENVSCLLEVQVLSNSSSKLDIVFSYISYNQDGTENIINAKNRNINILLYGTTDSFQSRIISTNTVNFVKTINTEIEATDVDNPFKNTTKYSEYSHAYRVGYNKSDTLISQNYDGWGKTLIETTGKTIVETKLVVEE